MPWGFEGIQAIRPTGEVRQLPMMAGPGGRRTRAERGFGDELQAARPLTDERQSLDRSHWPTCAIASSTSGTRPAPKMNLCCPSETACTIICLAYSRTDVS